MSENTLPNKKECLERLDDLYAELDKVKDPIPFTDSWVKACSISEKIQNVRKLLEITIIKC